MLSNYTVVKRYIYCQTLHCQTALLSNGSKSHSEMFWLLERAGARRRHLAGRLDARYCD